MKVLVLFFSLVGISFSAHGVELHKDSISVVVECQHEDGFLDCNYTDAKMKAKSHAAGKQGEFLSYALNSSDRLTSGKNEVSILVKYLK